MRIAYLECFSGMSGDMFLGALIDAGVPPRVLEETVAALGVGARLEFSRVVRSGISAIKVDVWVDGEKDSPRDVTALERIRHIEEKALRALGKQPTRSDSHSHSHEHSRPEHSQQEHPHSHGDAGSRAEPALSFPEGAPTQHEHPHTHAHAHSRGLTEIRGCV